MKPQEDSFGQMLWACFNGGEAFEVVERDDGYIAAISSKGYFSIYEEWPAVEKRAMGYVKGRVLDVGCGAGRHSLYLQEKDFDVTGIDISPLAIKICKLRGLKNAQIMSIEDVNFRQNSFDTIMMMGNNFGLFGSFENAQELLERFDKITSNKALIIADTRDPYKTDNSAHLQYHKSNRQKKRMGGQIRIRIRFGKFVGRWFDYLMVSKEEMKEILEETRWKITGFLDTEGPRYIAVIRKEFKNPK